jgi:hypothetical protein
MGRGALSSRMALPAFETMRTTDGPSVRATVASRSARAWMIVNAGSGSGSLVRR